MQFDEKMALSIARLSNANECLRDAHLLAEEERYKSLMNRSYYAIFHAMRAVLALDEIDSKKHSGIVSEFRKRYIKTGVFGADMSVIISKLLLARTNSDYDDFYVVSKEDAIIQFHSAEKFVGIIENYIKTKSE